MNRVKSLKSLCLLTGLVLFPASALADVECDYERASDIKRIKDDGFSYFEKIDQLFQKNTKKCIKFEDARDRNECLGSTYVFITDDSIRQYKGLMIDEKTVNWTTKSGPPSRVDCFLTDDTDDDEAKN